MLLVYVYLFYKPKTSSSNWPTIFDYSESHLSEQDKIRRIQDDNNLSTEEPKIKYSLPEYDEVKPKLYFKIFKVIEKNLPIFIIIIPLLIFTFYTDKTTKEKLHNALTIKVDERDSLRNVISKLKELNNVRNYEIMLLQNQAIKKDSIILISHQMNTSFNNKILDYYNNEPQLLIDSARNIMYFKINIIDTLDRN